MLRLILIAILVWPLAASSEVYKWVDKDGNVHFSDQKPEDEADAEEVDISAAELTPKQRQVLEQTDELSQQSADTRAADQARQDEQRERQRTLRREKVERHADLCQKGRRGLASVEGSARVYRTDEQGNNIYLNDDERVNKIKVFRKMVTDYCT